MEPKIVGKKIIEAKVNIENLSEKGLVRLLRKQNPEELVKRALNSTVSKVDRRAKYLVSNISNNGKEYVILVHLGMAGAWLANNDLNNIPLKFRNHIHVDFLLDDGTHLVFSDIRRMGGITIYTKEEFESLSSIKGLGPEPFWENADIEFLSNIRKKKWNDRNSKVDPLKRCIKVAIMDQSVVAGIGNIYACEALHRTGINPTTPVWELTDDQLLKIFEAARDLMAYSITVGGSSISDYVDGNGMMGSFQDHLQVYGQSHCGKCNTPITRIDLGRTSHYCSNCQK